MTKGIPKKRQRAEQLRKKRLQAAPARAVSAKVPSLPARRSRPSSAARGG
jgi:hypothetical protein